MKTEIKKLDSLSHNDIAATKLINDNFAALQQGIEDSLSRTGKTPNFMDKELDMNSKRIINTGDPVDETDAVNYGTYKKHIDQAVDAARSAAISANNAQNSAVETRQYARQARTSRDEAKNFVNNGKADITQAVSNGLMNISNATNSGKEAIEEAATASEEILKKYPLTTFFNPFVLKGLVFDTDGWTPSTTYAEEGYNFVKTVTYNTLLPMPSGKLWDSAAFVTLNMKEAVSGNFGPYATAFLTDSNGMAVLGISLYAKTLPTEQFSIASISWFIKEKPNDNV